MFVINIKIKCTPYANAHIVRDGPIQYVSHMQVIKHIPNGKQHMYFGCTYSALGIVYEEYVRYEHSPKYIEYRLGNIIGIHT